MNMRDKIKFNFGEVVCFKEIVGPAMVVLNIDDGRGVQTGWFDLANKYHTEWFSYQLLRKVNDEKIYIKTEPLSRMGFEELRTKPDFQSALMSGKKIEAIKLARQYTGMGLKEAKELVEEIMNSGVR